MQQCRLLFFENGKLRSYAFPKTTDQEAEAYAQHFREIKGVTVDLVKYLGSFKHEGQARA